MENVELFIWSSHIVYCTPPPTPLIIALYLLDNQTSLNLHRWSTQDLAQQLITTLWWVLFTWKMLRGACWDCLSRHLAPQWWSPYTGGQWNVIKFTLWETSHAPSVRSCLYVNLINNSRFWLNQNSQFVEIFHQTGPSLQLTVLVSYSKIWMEFCEFCLWYDLSVARQAWNGSSKLL